MTTLIINNCSYVCPSSWAEMNWRQFVALKTYAECGIREQYNGARSTDLLVRMCGVEPEIAQQTDPAQRRLFARCLMERFNTTDLRMKETDLRQKEQPPHEPNQENDKIKKTRATNTTEPREKTPMYHQTEKEEILYREPPVAEGEYLDPESLTGRNEINPYRFDWRGEQLCMPETLSNFEGEPMPLAEVSALELCEATDLYHADRWRYAPLIAAILCRPPAEEYDEKKVRERAEGMKTLPVTVIQALYDRLQEAHRVLKMHYPLGYQKLATKRTADPMTWKELLLWAGHFDLLEVERMQRLNGYDFLAWVHSRIKAES